MSELVTLKMQKQSAGPLGVRNIGDKITVTKAEAHALLLDNAAVPVTDEEIEVSTEDIEGKTETRTDTPPADAAAIDATDSAVALAEAGCIDLATVTGTGKDGKILKRDIEKLLE